ncbi:MAG: hypothetical protein F6K19_46400 [Cyanothece sp. SIO1E1]|nr:hypothetical protein [Cyanothece sp. SIO1E1]
MATLSDILDEDLLTNLAGDRYFERGVDYFERGLVQSLAQDGDHITAEVSGTERYQVHLWLEDDELMSRCTCPLGVDDLFCKHCVAVGLAWIDEPPPYRPAGNAPAKAGTTMQDVRDYLARQERDVLVKLILDQAMEDTRWRQQLLMKAAAQHAGGADINTFRRSLRNAIITGDFVDYYAAAGYADDVQSVVDGLEDLLAQGYASDVIELTEEAIGLLETALNSIDDSNGNLNSIMDQLPNLHYRACLVARPNPHALAERLFNMEMQSGYGFFSDALDTYAAILGEAGRATYQQLVDAEWEQLPELGNRERYSFDYRRSKLNRMKENLVAASGTLADLVAVMAKDLSRPYRYLQIAKLYQEHGQTDEAISWAETGLEAFSDSHHAGQLGDFLIAEYEHQGRLEDAINIVWQDFCQSSSLPLYQKLKQQADKANAWSEWREKALVHVRQAVAKTTDRRVLAHIGYSLLVEIFLWEGDLDQAWQAAQTGGCSKNLWMQLAAARAADHPEDALSVYQPAIEPLINQTSNEAYSKAVDLLLKVRDLMARLNRQSEFETFLANLSTTYKRKRNFIKFLKQRNLGR